MKTIRFSHAYRKLFGDDGKPVSKATLLAVIPVNVEDLNREFIGYDTDEGRYKLPPKGKYLMLIFEKPSGVNISARNLFTTLRSYNPSKSEYYVGSIGKVFNVQIRGPSVRT